MLLFNEAIDKPTGSLFNMSLANDGPDITDIFFVFNSSLTISDRKAHVSFSIPLDAIQIGISLSYIL